ncbi:hypothetical protein D3C72_759810 [compost metagenome]
MASLAVGSGASMSARSNTSASCGAPNTSGEWNATLYGSIFFGCGPCTSTRRGCTGRPLSQLHSASAQASDASALCRVGGRWSPCTVRISE